MIRRAVAGDILAMVRMAGDFIASADLAIPFDPDYLTASLRAHLAATDRLALVLDRNGAARGMLCAAASRSPLAPVAVATELAFWIDPDCRGRAALELLHQYIAWARDLGCSHASMMALPGRSLERLYGAAGFLPAEMTYSKVL
ncbi:GNAT family N-acetyltransferase [Oceaniovalibus sp. ACAM 378]|uniref:GNAT family N-acetyltransferase n=1 Tax=Oceaniovalibus sp. ACAM 378 TaxID=2599923 RepID=UPI0011DA2679|nr:GNAT family N-acetyltransferase [Oceaniovalibus sp. ACAM 378]TYB83974.1 GNAT family N-acetyltransferase [Oceaniovalibus sp. ACAM 378]